MVRTPAKRGRITGLSGAGLVIAGLVVVAMLLLAGSRPVRAGDAYDLLFRTGTLDGLAAGTLLTYERQLAHANGQGPRESAADTSAERLQLLLSPDSQAILSLRQKNRSRVLGSFPAKVGNPLLLYFVESLVRDMAAATGGSPFYIRNRLKASLAQDIPRIDETIQIGKRTIKAAQFTWHPFDTDPHRDRMAGFADLSLTVRTSPDLPGWYVDLEAFAGGAPEAAPVYRHRIAFSHLEGKS